MKATRRIRTGRGPLLSIVVVLAILVALFAVVTWMPLRQAREAWRSGHVAEAIAKGESWRRTHMWPAQYHELLAASYLAGHRTDKAQEHLDALRGDSLWFHVLPKDEVARRLVAQQQYADFLAYDAATQERGERPDVALYRAASQLALGNPAEAEQSFHGVDASKVDAKKYAALRLAIEQRKQGSAPYVFDRNGRAIASYQLANDDVVPVDAGFAPLVEADAGELTFEAQRKRLGTNDTIETTLDPVVQKAALDALGGFRGSLVAIDPKTNEILAIASTRGNGPMKNLALESQYEPGSVVKVLTGLNAVDSGLDLKSMFPYHCSGDLMIDGRHFGDWMATGHGTLNSIDDALAVSCNVAFADIGIRLGVDRLKSFMTTAGFDSQTNLGAFVVPLGKTVGPIFNKYETAFYAIGLEHESINALHLAMVASMMANRGVLTQPRLVTGRHSLLGESVMTLQPLASTRIAKQQSAETMIGAMQAVVTNARGTGRRAPVDGVPIAMKTGTAGKRENGFQALIVAFAPVADPKIAFGIIAEDAGPAEFAGAKIAHDFVSAMKPRL